MFILCSFWHINKNDGIFDDNDGDNDGINGYMTEDNK